MPVGFACTSQTATSVADEFLSSRKKFNPLTLKEIKDENKDISEYLKCNSTRDEILNPSKYYPEEFDTSKRFLIYSNKYFVDFAIRNFRINFNRDTHQKKYGVNLTLDVRVGNEWTFHPETIKKNMIKKFDLETYNLWRQNLKDSIDDAKEIIKFGRKLLTKKNMRLAMSAVSCSSSARFCERIGLFVHRGRAFLLPEKYSY